MKRSLSQAEKLLYLRIDEVLHYLWDPIHVSGVPQARDEYDSYIPQVFSMLRQGFDRTKISEYLISIERDTMGLAMSNQSRDKTLEIGDILIGHKECIEEQFEPRG